jgi:hypothetical protein
MRWPLTERSFGRCNSCGVISVCELLRDPVVRAASVFARPREKGDKDEGAVMGEVEEGSEKAGCDGERCAERSEACERDRDPMGTVRLLRLVFELRGFHSALRWPDGWDSSGGISSGAGSGRSFTTATSWCSVQVSEWSLRPFQKGASRRSICARVRC